MSTSVEELAAQSIHLSAEDRTRLAYVLLAPLPEETDGEVEAAWDAELQRRVEAVRAETATLFPSEEVHVAARKLCER